MVSMVPMLWATMWTWPTMGLAIRPSSSCCRASRDHIALSRSLLEALPDRRVLALSAIYFASVTRQSRRLCWTVRRRLDQGQHQQLRSRPLFPSGVRAAGRGHHLLRHRSLGRAGEAPTDAGPGVEVTAPGLSAGRRARAGPVAPRAPKWRRWFGVDIKRK